MVDEQKKSSKLGLGLVLGTLIGGLAAFFFSPKSGEENREMVAKKIKQLEKLLKEKEVDKKVKEVFGEVTDEAVKLYNQAKTWLIEDLATLKEAVDEIDKEKYTKAVENVVKRVEKEAKKDVKQLEKLKKQLMKEWEKLRK
jgi:gas vesicle protein